MPFTGAYERTIDAKNRIQIPAQFRSVMDPEAQGEAFYLCPGERRNTLSLYPERTFEERANQLRTEQISGEDSLAFEQLYYSLASRLEMDKQGRVVLPERQLALVNLGKEITLAGASTRVDIWATREYQEFVQSSFATQWPDLQKFMRQTLERRAEHGTRD
jgi:MraZ protein